MPWPTNQRREKFPKMLTHPLSLKEVEAVVAGAAMLLATLIIKFLKNRKIFHFLNHLLIDIRNLRKATKGDLNIQPDMRKKTKVTAFSRRLEALRRRRTWAGLNNRSTPTKKTQSTSVSESPCKITAMPGCNNSKNLTSQTRTQSPITDPTTQRTCKIRVPMALTRTWLATTLKET